MTHEIIYIDSCLFCFFLSLFFNHLPPPSHTCVRLKQITEREQYGSRNNDRDRDIDRDRERDRERERERGKF